MVGDEGVVGTVPEADSPACRIDIRFVASSTEKLQERGQQSSTRRARTRVRSGLGPDICSAFAGDIGHRVGAGRARQAIEPNGKDLRREVVVAGRERDGHITARSSIELGRTSRPRPAAATPAPVLGFEQTAGDETIEVERGELAADAQRRRGVVATDELAMRGNELVDTTPTRFVEQGNRRDRIAGGEFVRHDAVLPEMSTV
jgi:hypothetical protein